jgi:hypothetical protein
MFVFAQQTDDLRLKQEQTSFFGNDVRIGVENGLILLELFVGPVCCTLLVCFLVEIFVRRQAKIQAYISARFGGLRRRAASGIETRLTLTTANLFL